MNRPGRCSRRKLSFSPRTNAHRQPMMTLSRALQISLVFTALLAAAFAPGDDPKWSGSQGLLNRKGLAYNTCRCSSKLNPTQKKFIHNFVRSVMTTCALDIATALTYPWGSVSDIMTFFPRATQAICLIIRIMYGRYANEDRRLPRRLASNSSEILDLADLLLKVALRDHSVTEKMCNVPLNRSVKKVCYIKAQVLQAAELGLKCFRKVLNEKIPESEDTTLLSLTALMKRISTSSIASFIG